MEPGEVFVRTVISGSVLLPLAGTVVSTLKGRPVLASLGGVAAVITLIGISAELGNTEPSLSGLVGIGMILVSAPFTVASVLGAIGTAQPDSWWWKHVYSVDKQATLAALNRTRHRQSGTGE